MEDGEPRAVSASISAELFNPTSLLSRTEGEFEKGLKLGKLLIRANARLKLFERGECGRKNNTVEMQLGHTFLGKTAKAASYLLSDSISYYSQVLVLEVPDVRGDACVRRRMGKWWDQLTEYIFLTFSFTAVTLSFYT